MFYHLYKLDFGNLLDDPKARGIKEVPRTQAAG
jgi:hypothetical protein